MFCTRFFCVRMFATRFFCKVGATPIFIPAWAMYSNKTVGMDIQPQ